MNRPEAINEACVALEAAKARQTEPIDISVQSYTQTVEAMLDRAELLGVGSMMVSLETWRHHHKLFPIGQKPAEWKVSMHAKNRSDVQCSLGSNVDPNAAFDDAYAQLAKNIRVQEIRERVEREVKLTPTPQLCPHCQAPLSRLSASPECVPTRPFGCSESEHHQTCEVVPKS